MIGYLEGTLLKKEEERILLLVNHVGYEILLPAVVMETLTDQNVGDPLSLYIYYYQTERQPKPTLIGFQLEAEKEFFQMFLTVEDIGPIKAAKALTLPVRKIAAAIEQEDVKALSQMKGVGKRTAQKIIATLAGKMGKFVLIRKNDPATAKPSGDYVGMVVDVLIHQLGHKSGEAEALVAEAFERNPGIDSPEALFDEVYRGVSAQMAQE